MGRKLLLPVVALFFICAVLCVAPAEFPAQLPEQNTNAREDSGNRGPQAGRGGYQRSVESRWWPNVCEAAPSPCRPGSEATRWDSEANFRMGATALLGWKIGLAASSFPDSNLFTSIGRADALSLSYLDASSLQKVNLTIPKYFDYNLQPGEISAIQEELFAFNMPMVAYDVPAIGSDEASIRKVFDFAKGMRVVTIVTAKIPADLPLLDTIASEYGINVAIQGKLNTVLQDIQDRSTHLGVCGDTGTWLREGIKPLAALSQAKDRLLVVRLGDRNALGPTSHAVELGTGVGQISEFLSKMYQMNVKPSIITVDANVAVGSMADMSRAYDAFENALRPVMAARVDEISRTVPIKGPDLLSPAEKKAVDDALPTTAPATPKKPRKLLVLDLNAGYGGHRSIPAENYAIQRMGEITGAYTAIFSNDLDNLKWPKIEQYDAVFLDNTVGLDFPDPEVRAGLIRFVREGGGLGGLHGVTYTSMNWREFHAMIGGVRGNHRGNGTEKVWIKIDDPNSPLTAGFHGQEFEWADEIYRQVTPEALQINSREKLHELLSIDVARTDMHQGPQFNTGPVARPDADYELSWIHSYGKGRVFICTLGHNPTIVTTPETAQFILAGIQFILGDLKADATPTAQEKPH
ncbi:MAG: ThuA domain-containing protein [Candidatus Acidiferrales bacterium]